MREIKFRGKMLDSDDWVYGYYILCPKIDLIFKNKIYCDDINKLVDIQYDTRGQYTGLKDKNGKEIYEGDVVYCQAKYGKARAKIEFFNGKFVAYWNSAITHPKNGHHIAYYDINSKFEVIGNIYDNPELLEVN